MEIRLGIFILILVLSSCGRTAKVEDSDTGRIENGLLLPIALKGEENPKFSILERMQEYRVPGTSIAIVKDGTIKWSRAYGLADVENKIDVDTTTLFQAGSISKPIAALAVLKLVEGGALDLDADVNDYLKSWKVPDSPYTDSMKVTLRGLLSHSAGTSIHGFPGYMKSESVPSTLDVIIGKGNTDSVKVIFKPGEEWKYSGGGYTIMQLVVEDVTGMDFSDYMDTEILPSLGMMHSTYSQPLKKEYRENASSAFNWQGVEIDGKWNTYPEKAAAGLWTTPNDLARYVIQIQKILRGGTDKPISKEMAEEMITPHLNDWGLGPALSGAGDSVNFRHGGKNAGFTNVFSASAYHGYAAIIMTNADQGGDLMGEIMRSICAEYGWDFMVQKEVEVFSMDDSALESFAGAYKWDSKGQGTNYYVDLEVKDEGLLVVDTNDNEKDHLLPIDSLSFIDPTTGDLMEFKQMGEGWEFMWNDQFRFVRID